jgi:hypothetical protein
VFETRALRKMFGIERDEVTRDWRKLHTVERNEFIGVHIFG